MKQLSTKSIGSLLGAIAATIGDAGKRVSDKHLERMLQRHDRKGELRAGILGMTPYEFRDAHRHHSFDSVIRLHGFKNRDEFRLALRGKLRAELLQRGWSRQKIDTYVDHKSLAVA